LSPGKTLVIADELRAASPATARVATAKSGPVEIAPTPDSNGSLDDVERRHIESVLNQTNWMIEGERGAAKILDMNPSTLRSRMQKLGIKRPARASAEIFCSRRCKEAVFGWSASLRRRLRFWASIGLFNCSATNGEHFVTATPRDLKLESAAKPLASRTTHQTDQF